MLIRIFGLKLKVKNKMTNYGFFDYYNVFSMEGDVA